MTDILASLNAAQIQAVTHVDSPLLILAGPGSGKTTVICAKIAWLIHEQGQRPEGILAMTFTNKAAKEMLLRVQNTIGIINKKPYISTFHSFGAYMLRRFSSHANVASDFQIYDADDSLALLKQISGSTDSGKLRGMLSGISRAKDFGISSDASDETLKEFMFKPDIYRDYERVKNNTGNVDFGDLLIMTHKLLSENTQIKELVKRWWQWFLIDEYQDTNRIQFLLLKELCGHTQNICVVGDDDQSIYKFRGAMVENILTFDKLISNVTVIKLEQNYRSTPSILDLANAVIEPNSERHGKRIFSTLQDKEKPKFIMLESEESESKFIVKTIQQSLKKEKTCALFFRTNAQSRQYEAALRAARIPYMLVGATHFFQRVEVKDTIALARVFRNPKDTVSFLRIANKPTRGIGQKSLDDIANEMHSGISWTEAYKKAQISSNAQKGCEKLAAFLESAKHERHISIGDICTFLVEESGIGEFYKKEERAKNIERVSNVEEFINYAHKFENTTEGWVDFLEEVSLAENVPHEESTQMQLMTLHRSKGLEFDTVIICAVEEETIPMIKAHEAGDENNEQLRTAYEEERRLLYVGITRAKEALYLTSCFMRRKYGQTRVSSPSSFLSGCEDLMDVKKISEQPRNREMYQHNTAATKHNNAPSATMNNDAWEVGERVHHKDFGYGFVRTAKIQGSHMVLRVEFDNEKEGDFIPKFDSSLCRAKT